MIGKNFTRQRFILTVPFLFVLVFIAGLTDANAVTLFGVTNANSLVRFESATPETIRVVGAITGLQTGENVLGIDFRPATGQLYALGSTSRLYTINIATGAATAVGAAGAFTLSGTDFGFDFNPTVDRIRVVSNTGQNLRLNPNDGTLTATDTPLNPGTPQVTAAAYTNNFAGATTTTLFDIDSGNDMLFTQNPPNAGTLVPVGALGINVGSVNGFDIAAAGGTALAAFQLAGSTTSQLYSINLTTGAATLIGAINSATPLRGLAIAAGSAASTTVDFDGDRRTDYAVFRLSTNTWFVNRSSDNSFFAVPFGMTGDVFTPGDYDGDGRTDISVWRPSNGVFYVLRSSDNTVQFYQFGLNGDEPAARDYDGDGRTDFAVVRRTGGQMIWYINNSANNTFRIQQFGLSSDVVVPGDYDGDGRFDLAVFRGSGDNTPATFFVLRSTGGLTTQQWGVGSDLVVTGDYDGDGRTDFAVLRTGSQYQWFVLFSGGGSSVYNLGTKPHLSTQGDYNGDGRTDVSVWDPVTGIFYVLQTNNGVVTQRRFGMNGDYPIANFDTH